MSNNRRRGPMGGPGRGMAPGEKAKDLKGTMVKLIKYMRRFYVPIVMVIIFAIASTVFNIVGPTILGDATTEIFKGLVRKVSGGSGIDFDTLHNSLDGTLTEVIRVGFHSQAVDAYCNLPVLPGIFNHKVQIIVAIIYRYFSSQNCFLGYFK